MQKGILGVFLFSMETELNSIIEDGGKYEVVFTDENLSSGKINKQDFLWDVKKIGESHFSIIKDNKSFIAEVLKADYAEKAFFLKVNGKRVKIVVEDQYDELLKKLGMDDLVSSKIDKMLAPMPGLVLSIKAAIGQQVEKGDQLLVLEAMKMENVLKSPTDGVIKTIMINTGEAVEKNQLLVEFQ